MEYSGIPANIEEFKGSTEIEQWVRRFIEYDLMDPAWFEILRRHPEIQLDSDGKKVNLPRNHNLKKYVHIDQSKQSEQMNSSVAYDNKHIIIASIDDKVSVLSKTNLETLSEITLRSDSEKLPSPAGLPTSQLLPGTFYHLKAQSHSAQIQRKVEENDIAEEVDVMVHHHTRLVYLTVDLFVEILGADPAAKKGKDKNAPVDLKPRTFMRYRVAVVDVYGDEESPIVEKVCDWYLTGDIQPEFDVFDTSKVLNESVQISLSDDGRILSILLKDAASSQCQLFDLPAVKAPSIRADFNQSSAIAVGVAPTLVALWKVDNVIRDMSIIIIPDNVVASDSQSTATEEELNARRMVYYEKNILILLSIVNSSFLPLILLTKKPQEVAVPTKGAKAPPKGAIEIIPPPSVLCIPIEALRVRLSSAPTAFATSVMKASSSKEQSSAKPTILLAVGQVDGLVSLWNLLENTCFATLGQHQTMTNFSRKASGVIEKSFGTTMISSLKFISAGSLSTQPENASPYNVIMLLAGAVDGTLSLYSSAGSLFDDLRVNTPKFVDFRHDLYEDPILDIDIIRVPANPAGLCFLTHHASGLRLLYKLYRGRNMLLVSTLSLEERVDFRDIKSSFLSVENIPRNTFIPPHDLLNPPPPAEPVAAGKAAAKGKDAAPVPEPEPEPTPEELAEKAAAEERKKAEDYLQMMLNLKTSSYSIDTCVSKLKAGSSLRGMVGIGCVNADGQYIVSLSRDGKAAIGSFPLVSFVTQALDSDEVLQQFMAATNRNAYHDNSMVQETSVVIPEPSVQLGGRASAKGVSRVRSALPISSANTQSLATLNTGSVVSYKQVKLTEQRLHAHEQQLAETRRGFFDSNSQSALDEIGQEEDAALSIPQGPNVINPELTAKGEILRMKRDKLKARPGAFSKKLTTLASLC